MAVTTTKKGDCESCGNIAIDLNLRHGTTWQCAACDLLEAPVIAAADANRMIQETRAVDSAIVLKADIYNAQTPAVAELIKSVQADDSIPASQKDRVIADECFNHFKHLQQVIFEARQEFLKLQQERENELRMWQTQVQVAASKLQAEAREKYKDFDKSYTPAPVKPSKSTKVKSPAEFKKNEFAEACKKYGVPMAQTRQVMVRKNISADAAAKLVAEALNGSI